MDKYHGFSPKEVMLLRRGMSFVDGYPEKELQNFLETCAYDYQVMHQEEVVFYADSIRIFRLIMKNHPEIIHDIGVARTKSYGTDKFIEFVFQLHADGNWYIGEEIEYLIKHKLKAS